jgi:cytochrome c1
VRRGALAVALGLACLAFALVSCSGKTLERVRVTQGSPDLGKTAIVNFGCGSCHTIPGVKGAEALVGPPLTHFSKRSYVGGHLANTPDNLAHWIEDPQSVSPGTDMPDLGVSPEEARNIAAYLLSLG